MNSIIFRGFANGNIGFEKDKLGHTLVILEVEVCGKVHRWQVIGSIENWIILIATTDLDLYCWKGCW